MISKELYTWLQREFYQCNHPKYRKYFEKWIENVLPHQIEGFEKQRIGQLTGNKKV